MLSSDDGKFPVGVRPFRPTGDLPTLDETYSSVADEDVVLSLTLRKGSTRSECMASVHRWAAKLMKGIEVEAFTRAVAVEKTAASKTTYTNFIQKTVVEPRGEADELQLFDDTNSVLDQALLASAVEPWTKPTSGPPLAYDSDHPRAILESWPLGVANRVRKLATTSSTARNEICELAEKYTDALAFKAARIVSSSDSVHRSGMRGHANDVRTWLPLTFHPALCGPAARIVAAFLRDDWWSNLLATSYGYRLRLGIAWRCRQPSRRQKLARLLPVAANS